MCYLFKRQKSSFQDLEKSFNELREYYEKEVKFYENITYAFFFLALGIASLFFSMHSILLGILLLICIFGITFFIAKLLFINQKTFIVFIILFILFIILGIILPLISDGIYLKINDALQKIVDGKGDSLIDIFPFSIVMGTIIFFSITQFSKTKAIRLDYQHKISLVCALKSIQESNNVHINNKMLSEKIAENLFRKPFYKKDGDLPIETLADLMKAIKQK